MSKFKCKINLISLDNVVVVETRFLNIYIERPNLTSYEEVMIFLSFNLAVCSPNTRFEIERFLAETI